MNLPHRSLVLLACLLPSFAPAQEPDFPESQDEAEVTIKQIGVSVEYFQLDHRTANREIRKHLSARKSDATDMRNALSALVAEKKAERISSGYLVTRSGQRAKIESIVEHIYPTEFDPPEVPEELSGPIDADVDLQTGITPTAFETRNSGLTVEVDPVLGSDGATVDLNIATELVDYLGARQIGQNESRMSSPVFNRLSDATAITSRDGNWAFIGTHRPAPTMSALRGTGAGTADEDELIVVLVRLDVIEISIATTDSSEVIDGPMVINTLGEYIEVDAAAAETLMTSLALSGSSSVLREELELQMESGKAKLLETATVTTRSGQRAKSSSSSEWIFPSEMDPPEMPRELAGPIEKSNNLITPLTYTAFETRNVGTTLEIDPVAGVGGVVIDVNIAPDRVAYLGDNKFGLHESQAEVPMFSSLRSSTAVSLRSNHPLLINVYVPIDQKTKKPAPAKRVFFFLTATSLQVEVE